VELSGCGGVVEDADLTSVFGTESAELKLVTCPSAGECGIADWVTGDEGPSAKVELSGCGGVVEDADLASVFETECAESKLVNRPSAGEFGMADWATGGSGSSAAVELSDCEGVAAGADLAGPKLVPRSSTAGSVDPAALIVLLSSILSGAARI